ncbi:MULTISPECIES: S9 family peptidase [Bacteroides]|jgi:dipeptidyl-peptidase-4|uniref:Peptidase S9 n=1 Tax=Bacteroides fragilis TaxID=817 RepID=A0A081U9L0_BACFG|nr:S9 family peptidase [Bacteroides fragilis]MBY2902985.1 peptidase S9 [Bacteroides fragilis]MCE8566061.1 S9 family peptidase [Bacteroides fragilis]MCE8575821.1 S9 family peptidase [Bacteroides fragilis]MCE8614231.1 S9 family peptidase [Bacteroides fragilis]MCM0195067.1 S9 family peptidase [Bacteroides fragilis]
MKRKFIFLFFCLCCLAGFAQGGKALDLKEINSGKFSPENIYGVVPMPDGEHYTQRNAEGTQIVKYSFRTGEPVEVVFDVAKARECPFKKFDSYQFSPDGSKILIATETTPIYRHSYTAVHYLYPVKRNDKGVTTNNIVEKLSDGGPQQAPVFSPDGNLVAFVRDNNIFLVKLLYGNSESQVTEDGKLNSVLNGIPDWVYEEEFGFNRALEFNADNTMLAYVRFDESEVPSYTFPLFAGEAPRNNALQDYPGEYTYKYPKAGYPNSKVSVHTFDIKSKVTRQVKLPIDADGYIPRIRFTQDPNKLAIMTLNRHQNRFDMYFADPRSTVCKLALRDESPYYINENVFDNIRFYPDNFSFVSDKSGYPHLYWYSMNGNLIKQVTSGNYEVKNFIGWNPDTNEFYYTSNEESPMRQAVYKIDRKGKKVKLSNQQGTNSPIFSSSMKYFMNKFTSLDTPMLITLNDNTGKVLKTLVTNDKLKEKLAGYAIPQKEFFTFKTTEGVDLNGWMMKPVNFDPSKRYPVLMFQYSGPGSQQVLDEWGISWETYMASLGYVVACVDGRGTGGRGSEFQKCTYLNLGVKEAKDQVEAAKYLGGLPYVDKGRIGIWGWSFGGYMTIMSMSEGTPVFKAGVAVAAPTDWKYYDTVYTERFMRTPKENAEGYKAASAFSRADNLHGNLLLVHGMADDNVHFQNCTEYAEHLVQLGKQFDMQVYTNRNHGIYGGNTRNHLYTRLTNFFLNNL